MTSSENGDLSEDEQLKEGRKKKRKISENSAGTIVTAALRQLNADDIETITSDCREFLEPTVTTQPVFRNYPSDMVYVERKRGFSPAPREKVLSRSRKVNLKDSKESNDTKLAVESALKIQKAFWRLFNFCHGILAGLSLTLCVFISNVGGSKLEIDGFPNVYEGFARPLQSLFYFLTAVSAVSALERIDIARLCRAHVKELFLHHSSDILLLLLCSCVLGTTVTSGYWDEQLALHVHNTTGAWKDVTHTESSLSVWRNLNYSRCICAMGSWLVASMYPDGGLFYSHSIGILKLKLKPVAGASLSN